MQEKYLHENKDRFLEELIELLKIPSVSADPAFAKDVRKAAEFIAVKMKAAGIENVSVDETDGYPVVYVDKMIDDFSFLNKGEVSYAMGWFVTDDITMHTGGWYGTSTVVLREKNRPITITIFRNSDNSIDELIIKTYELVDTYLKKLLTIDKK